MQRFTVKLSYQPGKKLGLVLVDSPLEPEPYYSEPESDFDSDDEGILCIRGGGSTLGDHDPGSDRDDNSLPNIGFGGTSLQMDFMAEAQAARSAQAVQFAQVVRATQPAAAQTARVAQAARAAHEARAAQAVKAARGSAIQPRASKRKRSTVLSVSSSSIIFMFAEKVLASSFVAPKPNIDENINLCLHSVDPSDIDALVEWGRENVPPITFHGGVSLSLDEINSESLMFVLTRTIMPGDIVEKIQYTRLASATNAKLVPTKGKGSSDKRKRRCRPYFRSDHYTTFYCEDKPASELAPILRSPQNFPLYITFKRRIPVFNIDGSAGSTSSPNCNPPPRKRLKKSESNIGPTGEGSCTNNQQPASEVICLLDSSDEEEVDMGKYDTRTAGSDLNNGANTSPQVPIEIDSSTNSSSTPHQRLAAPDPSVPLFDDDDFVLTPFGAGKILSSRVERYASSDSRSDATIFNPTIIYSVDLHFGICHVPARRVKSISGTSYTEKSILTYQRVPLNEHDLLRLRPMTYLNDSIVMFFLKYLKTQLDGDNAGKSLSDERGWDDLDGKGIHIFPSFAYTRIKNIMGPLGCRNSRAIRTKIWNDLKTWTKGVDIFKKKYLVFPVNESLHWTCVFVFHPGRLVRRYAKGLSGRKENSITVKSATNAPHSATNTNGAIPEVVAKKSTDGGKENQSQNKDIANKSHATENGNSETNYSGLHEVAVNDAVVMKSSDGGRENQSQNNDIQIKSQLTKNGNSAADNPVLAVTFPGAVMMKSSDGGTVNQSQNHDASNESKTTNNEKSAKDGFTSTVEAKPAIRNGQKWQCDYCNEAKFDDYDDAVEHEKICEKNVDWCMIHFDSGKHFKLHKTTEITGNIRKYLNAYYDAEYASSHPGLSSFTMKNMPGFTTAVPQQDNTKDCGVFMLENVERVLRIDPSVDNAFVKGKGLAKNNFFGRDGYDKNVIEKKRDDILQLVQTMRRRKNTIDLS